jgi:hypothetical protein
MSFTSEVCVSILLYTVDNDNMKCGCLYYRVNIYIEECET